MTDLEKALDGVRDKQAVHRKLATIYGKLGMKEIAEQHQLFAEETSPESPQATPGQ